MYVNVPAGATADEREAYHVGNVSLFGIEAVRIAIASTPFQDCVTPSTSVISSSG